MYGYNSFNGFNNQSYTPVDERIWVQNETAAEAYLVAPNSFVRLWDSSKPVFYEKRADATGRPMPLEAFEYKRREPKIAPLQEEVNNLYMNELEDIKARLSALEKGVQNEQSDANDTEIQ